MNLIVLTRVGVDDFDIFKIWVEYYKRRYIDIRCCIFQRPNDEISDLINFCIGSQIEFSILKGSMFDNGPTYDVLRDLAANATNCLCLVIDCDEFINDFDKFDELVRNMPADSVLLKMVDRVSHDIFYDISRCETYEDLCALAPLKSDLTAAVQNWSDEKCCLNRLPDLGDLHYPSQGKSSHLSREVYLDHFKWRSTWLKKAKRRLEEVTSIGYTWESGLRKILNIIADGKPRKYLTIPGYFDYDNIYEEQCRSLSDGSTLVEVGVWKGRSITYLAECAKLMGKKFKIYGVDLFEERDSTKTLWKDCSIRDTKNNLEWRKMDDNVQLLKKSSVEAALCFADKSVDFVWLDGDHSLESVMMDVCAWWPKVRNGGTIGGHDLPFHDVAEALEILEVNYIQDRTSWIVRDIPDDRPPMWVRCI